MRGFSSSVQNRFKKCKKKDQQGYGRLLESVTSKQLKKKSKKRKNIKKQPKLQQFKGY